MVKRDVSEMITEASSTMNITSPEVIMEVSKRTSGHATKK
jgi:hypothetical protein